MQTDHIHATAELKRQNVKDIEAARIDERELTLKEILKDRIDVETMTEVDGEREKILRQREFNQTLVSYRAINLAPRTSAKTTTFAVKE